MAGTPIRIGRYRTSSGPDLAIVYYDDQLGSFTNPASHASRLILYKGGTWWGRYSGIGVGRVGLHYTATDASSPGGKRVGGVATYTNEASPTTNYTGGGGGSFAEMPLATPFVTDSNYAYTVSVLNSHGSAIIGVAMYQAQDINETNESTYRKDNFGTTPVDMVGATRENNGQIVAWFEGEANVAPSKPTSVSRVSSSTTRRPVMKSTFNDANKVLNDGRAWDYCTKADHTWSWSGGSVTRTVTTSTAERGSHVIQAAPASDLPMNVTITYTVKHYDRLSVAGATSDPVTFIINHVNDAPSKPTALSPSGTLTGSLTRTLVSTFSDPDLGAASNSWERLESYRIRIMEGTTSRHDQTYTATEAERASKQTSRSYTFPAYDKTYTYYISHKDRSGAWSTEASTTVFISSGASVDQPSAPSGRVTNLANPGNVVATYRNTGGTSTQKVQIGLFDKNNNLVDAGTQVSATIAANGSISRPWTDLGYTLAPGTEYQVKTRALATGATQWSDWSPGRTITANAAPNIPTLGSPSNGDALSSMPYLYVSASDPDATAGTLTVPVELLDANGDVIATQNATWHAASGQYRTLFPNGVGSYGWQAYSYDGFLYSGGATTASGASRSAKKTFIYGAVPSVTLSAPVSPVSTMHPAITFTSNATFDRARLRIYSSDGDTLVFDSGERVISGTANVAVNSSMSVFETNASPGWIAGNQWNNGEELALKMSVRDSTTTLWGDSISYLVTLEYTAPDEIVIASCEAVSLSVQTVGTQAIELFHEQSQVSSEEFMGYLYWRTDLTGPDGTTVEGTRRLLKENTNQNDLRLLDAEVVSNQWYLYEVQQEVRFGVDEIRSPLTSASAMASWRGVMLHLPYNPIQYHAHLYIGPPGDSFGTTTSVGQSRRSLTTQNRKSRIFSMGKRREKIAEGSFTITNDHRTGVPGSVLLDQLDTLMACSDGYDSPDGRPHILCWRTGRGGRHGIIYGMLSDDSAIEELGEWNDMWLATLRIEDAEFVLGEETE